jgi:hypothetical protein
MFQAGGMTPIRPGQDPGCRRGIYKSWRGDPGERSNLAPKDVREIKERYKC